MKASKLYRCIKDFSVPRLNEDEVEIDDAPLFEIHKGSLWEKVKSDKNWCQLQGTFSPYSWLTLPTNSFNGYLEPVSGDAK